MKVDYYHQEEYAFGNIMWDKDLEKSSSSHAVESRPKINGVSAIEKFRSLGYYASFFPEGDGIAIKDESEQKTPGMVADDIINCFGWDVCIKVKKPIGI